MNHDVDDHDRGLAHDLEVLSPQRIARRRAPGWFAGAGTGTTGQAI